MSFGPVRGPTAMSRLRYSTSISLDGYVAGPDQSVDRPLGVGGERLHIWVRELAAWRSDHGDEGGETNASTEVYEEGGENVGAVIMGRNMFGGGPGPWGEPAWQGWWGDDPPFRLPVFVLTHHARDPLTLTDTTFTFVTGGIHEALELAQEAAGGRDVAIGGGGSVAQQYLAAGLLDEVTLHLVPTLLGAGVRLFDGVTPVALEQTRAVEAPGVVHLTYRLR
jgi:dihydrofolate reductase